MRFDTVLRVCGSFFYIVAVLVLTVMLSTLATPALAVIIGS